MQEKVASMVKLNQQGSTLIVVLALLVLITLIGTVAMKSSLVSLNVATNSQAQQIMTQSSDSAMFALQDPAQFKRYQMGNGVLGYMRTDANKEKELVFCLRNNATRFFDLNQASVIYWPSGSAKPVNNELGLDGYCDMSQANSYTSGRKAVMTQVAVRYTSTPTKPFEFYQRGTDLETAKLEETERLIVHSTSIMPSLANSATNAQINGCLSQHLNLAIEPVDAYVDDQDEDQIEANKKGKVSVSKCLSDLNVPHTTHVTEYTLG